MRHLILAAALLARAAAPAQAASAQAAFIARLDTGEGKIASMRWWLEGGTVRWTLTCLDESDPKGRPPDMATYRGVSRLEDGFLEGTVAGEFGAASYSRRAASPRSGSCGLMSAPSAGAAR